MFRKNEVEYTGLQHTTGWTYQVWKVMGRIKDDDDNEKTVNREEEVEEVSNGRKDEQ